MFLTFPVNNIASIGVEQPFLSSFADYLTLLEASVTLVNLLPCRKKDFSRQRSHSERVQNRDSVLANHRGGQTGGLNFFIDETGC